MDFFKTFENAGNFIISSISNIFHNNTEKREFLKAKPEKIQKTYKLKEKKVKFIN